MSDRPLDDIPNSVMPPRDNVDSFDDETDEMLDSLNPQPAQADPRGRARYDEEPEEQNYPQHRGHPNYPQEDYQNTFYDDGEYYEDDEYDAPTHRQRGGGKHYQGEPIDEPETSKSAMERLTDVIKVDSVVMVLFFLLSLPVVNKLLVRFIPRLSTGEGALNILGLLLKTSVFGILLFVIFFFNLI